MLARRNSHGDLQLFHDGLWCPAPIRGAHNAFTPTYTEWEGHLDNSGEWNATGQLGTNTDWTQDTDENFRIRFGVEETGTDTGGTNLTTQLQYRHVEGTNAWTNVSDVSSVVISPGDGLQTDQADTTQQITNGTYVTAPNAGTENLNGSIGGGDNDLPASEEVEYDFTILIVGADVTDADTVELRILIDGAEPASPDYPILTVNKLPPPVTTDVTSTAAISRTEQTDVTSSAAVSVSGLRVRAISDNSGNAGTAMTGLLPSGTQDDDYLIAFINTSAASGAISARPSGWAQEVSEGSPDDFQMMLEGKVASGEGASWEWTANETVNWRVIVIAIQDTGGKDVGYYEDSGASAVQNMAVGAMTTLTDDALVLTLVSVDATGGARTWTADGSPIEELDSMLEAHHSAIYSEVLATAGNITRTVTVSGTTQAMAAFMIAFKPVVDTVTTDVTSTAAVSRTITEDVTSTAAVETTNDTDVTSDAAVETINEKDVTSDAAVETTNQTDVTSDAAVEKIEDTDVTSDAAVETVETSDVTSDAAVILVGNADVGSDAAIEVIVVGDVTSDAAISTTVNASITSDAAIGILVEANVSSNAAIILQGSGNVTSNAAVSITITIDVSSSAAIETTNETNVTTNAAVETTALLSVSSDAAITLSVFADVTSDAAIELTVDGDVTSDAAISHTEQSEVTSDAAIVVVGNVDITSAAAISMGALVEITSSAAIEKVEDTSVSSDAAIETTGEQDVISNAAVEVVALLNITSDAALALTAALSVSSDAAITTAPLAEVSSSAAISVEGADDLRTDRLRLRQG